MSTIGPRRVPRTRFFSAPSSSAWIAPSPVSTSEPSQGGWRVAGYGYDLRLWDAIRESYRVRLMPTWTGDAATWAASDYAFERFCSLQINQSRAFARAHACFVQLASQLFGLSPSRCVCSFVTRYAADTNQALGPHTDHPGGCTVTFQGPCEGGATSQLLFYSDPAGESAVVDMVDGAACCFDADILHATAPVGVGERWVWVMFYQAAAAAPGGDNGAGRGGSVAAGPSESPLSAAADGSVPATLLLDEEGDSEVPRRVRARAAPR